VNRDGVSSGRAPPPPPEPGGGASVSSPALLFLLLTLGLLAVGMGSWRPVPAGVWHDDGVYMTVGQALARGDGLVYAGVPGAPPAVKFPPGYSALLSLLWTVLPGVGAVTLAATLLNVGLLAGAGGGLAWILFRHAGLDRPTALLAGGLGFVAADLWRLALVPLSEPLFVALLTAALWVSAREATRSSGLLLGVVLAAAVLTRSAAVALVAGFALPLVLRRRWGALVRTLAPPLAVALAWTVWSTGRGALVPPELADILGSYGGWLAGQLRTAPLAFVAALPVHALEILRRLGALLLPGTPEALHLPGVALLAPVLILGARRLGRSLPALPWIVAAYLGMLLVWPFADRRLVAPLLPLLVALAVTGGRVGLEALPRPGLRRVGRVMAALWVAGFLAVSLMRVAEGWAASPHRFRAERLAAALTVLEEAAAPSAVVGAPEFWAAIHLHGGWQAAPSARFRPRAEGGVPRWGSEEEQLATWARSGVELLVLEQNGAIHGDALNRLEAACPGAVTIVARMTGQMVVRLAPHGGAFVARLFGVGA